MKFGLQAERAIQNQSLLMDGIMPGPELGLSAYQMLEAATINGARALQLDHKIGSLTPGKEADFILIDRTSMNLLPMSDPAGAVVQTAHPSNVDSVYVAGKAVKQNGKLVGVNLEEVKRKAYAARDHILSHKFESTPS